MSDVSKTRTWYQVLRNILAGTRTPKLASTSHTQQQLHSVALGRQSQ